MDVYVYYFMCVVCVHNNLQRTPLCELKSEFHLIYKSQVSDNNFFFIWDVPIEFIIIIKERVKSVTIILDLVFD